MHLSYYVGSQLLFRQYGDASSIPRAGELVTLVAGAYAVRGLSVQSWVVERVARVYRVGASPGIDGAAHDVLGGCEVRISLHRPEEEPPC